jgi:hypothetical protein
MPSPLLGNEAAPNRCLVPLTPNNRQTKQNADKTRFDPGPVGVCLPPAFGIAPVRVWRTVNVHPPCLVGNAHFSIQAGAWVAYDRPKTVER